MEARLYPAKPRGHRAAREHPGDDPALTWTWTGGPMIVPRTAAPQDAGSTEGAAAVPAAGTSASTAAAGSAAYAARTRLRPDALHGAYGHVIANIG